MSGNKNTYCSLLLGVAGSFTTVDAAQEFLEGPSTLNRRNLKMTF